MPKKSKRFWLGDPELYESDDDDPGGHLQPDDNGDVYLNRDGSRPKKTSRKGAAGARKTRPDRRRGPEAG